MQEKEDEMDEMLGLHPYQKAAVTMIQAQPDGRHFLHIARRSGAPREMALPGGFCGDRISDRNLIERETFEERGFVPSMFRPSAPTYGTYRIERAIAAIATRHPDIGLRLVVETNQSMRPMLTVCVGEGAPDEIFAARTFDESADLLALVVMHLDDWILSRRTVLARDPGVKRYAPSSVLDRPGQLRVIADESFALKGGRGSARTRMQASLARGRRPS